MMVLGISLFAACTFSPASFEDVSSDPEYQGLVGTHIRSNSELFIYGITVDPNYAKVLAFYSVTGPPGISGPEILSSGTVPAGTSMEILGVQECTNCPFDHRVEVVVRLVGTKDYSDAPVRIPYNLVASEAFSAGGSR
jgi:hypothetical protein